MILQGKAVKFLYLSLSLLRGFFIACLAISDFSHVISPSPQLSLKRRMEERERDSTCRTREEWALGNNWEERAAEVGGLGLRMSDRAVV